MSDNYVVPAMLNARGEEISPSRVIRLKTPVISPDELLAQIAAKQVKPATVDQALELAAITLKEHLKHLLENFPYRDQPTAPVAIWARMTAVALERVISAQDERAECRELATRMEKAVKAAMEQLDVAPTFPTYDEIVAKSKRHERKKAKKRASEEVLI